jgi:DNA-binding helix-hairpin-helix protein with protein kinase domain
VQAISGIQEQNRQHANQVAAVNRSNAMARQDYLNKIQISAFNDQRKGEVFTAQLKADAASRAAYYKQKEINQAEATRALTASDQKLRERITEQAFQSQTNLAKAIQAQGTVLASGQQAGQSMLLSLNEAERDFGFKQAQIDATIFDATKNYGIEKYGIDLDQYGANTRALNAVTTTAAVAPSASFKTVRPIEKAAPSKPSALGPILGGFSTALSATSAIGGDGYIAERFGWD